MRPTKQVRDSCREAYPKQAEVAGVFRQLVTHPEGLTDEEADTRRAAHGLNVLAKDERAGVVTRSTGT